MAPDLASLPRPPEKPHPQECCGRGCCPCIFDYYDDALARWEACIRERGHDPDAILKAFDGDIAGSAAGAKVVE